MVEILPDGRANLIATYAFLVVNTICLLLRYISKRITGAGMHIDDCFILLAYLAYASQCSVIIYDVTAIAGTLDPKLVGDPPTLREMMKYLWIGSLHYPLVITAVKLSILSYYLSIFSNLKSFRIATHTVIALCIAWGIAVLCFILFGCRPIPAAYDLTLRLKPGTVCIPYGTVLISQELPNTILDAVILTLPIFVIRILQLPLRKKLLLSIVFLSGGFVIITCILRIVYSYDPQTPETFTSFSRANEWLMIQEGSAIVAACLPIFRPLLSAYVKLPRPLSKWFSSAQSAPTPNGYSNAHLRATARCGYTRFDDESVPPHTPGTQSGTWASDPIPLAKMRPDNQFWI